MIKNNVGFIMLGIILSLIMLFAATEFVTFNENYYKEMYIKYDIPKETGLTLGELHEVMMDVLLYLRDDRTLLDTTRIVDGKIVPAFGERAVLHMIDVKELFVAGAKIKNVGLIFFLGLIGLLVKKDHKWKSKLGKTFLYTGLINILLILILYLLMSIDFYKYFTYFHLIFFTNDLWLLDPNTELLIQMLPEGFFNDTAIRIATIFMGANLVLGALGYKGFIIIRKLTSLKKNNDNG